MTNKGILLIVFSLFVLGCLPNSVKAVELITNGGFENAAGFQGWTVVTAGNGYFPWQVTTAGGGNDGLGIAPSSPRFGLKDAWTGFCCNVTNNPEYIEQTVTLPAAQTASLQWSHKIQSDLHSFCNSTNCGSNTFRVQILTTSNVILQTVYTYTATFQPTNHNTGWEDRLVSLTPFAGQTIKIRFSGTYSSTVGGNLNGPGRAEVDGVSVQSPAVVVTAANASVGGKVSDETGRGLSSVSLILTDSTSGVSKTATTNSFGNYQFDELETGHFYIITIGENKRYTFANPVRSFQLNENAANVDFVGSPL